MVVECDIKNAFNIVGHSRLLRVMAMDFPDAYSYFTAAPTSQTTVYFQGGRSIESQTGVQQEDPLASLSFDLSMADITRELDTRYEKEMISIFIHDDGC